MRLNLLTKMMIFAALISVLPLVVSGQSLIRIARDELKSTANEQLVTTARQITDEFNDFYESELYSTLNLIRNALDGHKFPFNEKIAMLERGIVDLPDIVALQVDVQGAPEPLVVTQTAFMAELSKVVDDPLGLLHVEAGAGLNTTGSELQVADISYVEELDSWLATSSLVLPNGFAGRVATMHAQINLQKLREVVRSHPFALTGKIHVVDADLNVLFSTGDGTIANKKMVAEAAQMLETDSRALSVKPFSLDDGTVWLGAISFPRPFPWAVLVEKSEADAYLPVTQMISSLIFWLSLGLGAAIIGTILFSLGISRPILAISEAAVQVAKGNLDFRIKNVKSRDEIGTLADRFNEMITQLNERMELQKFVSHGTMDAIQRSDDRSVSLGGDRENVAILFADIRGYTEFSEDREPEEVVRVLNHYFQEMGDLVSVHEGDIDKFVGDQLMAVFHGERKARNAVRCAIDIMKSMEASKKTLPNAGLEIGIGVDMGEVVIGAMGSRDRMDYTVLGDHVNLAARLCSKAEPRQTLISKPVYKALSKKLMKKAMPLPAITVKGKAKPITIFGIEL